MSPFNDQDDQKLWELLRNTPQPRLPGNFADNVLREIRLSGAPASRRLPAWLTWAFTPVCAGAAALLIVSLQQQPPPAASEKIPVAEIAAITETAGQLAFNDIGDISDQAHLDDLLNTDENSLWLGTVVY